MTNKTTTRKNKTKLEVKWPDSYFTIDSLHKDNPDFVNITLRVRLKTALDNKKVVEIGTHHVGKGRPKLVFAVSPVSEATIQSARNADIMLNSSFDSVPVTTVSSTPNNTPPPAPVSTAPVDSKNKVTV